MSMLVFRSKAALLRCFESKATYESLSALDIMGWDYVASKIATQFLSEMTPTWSGIVLFLLRVPSNVIILSWSYCFLYDAIQRLANIKSQEATVMLTRSLLLLMVCGFFVRREARWPGPGREISSEWTGDKIKSEPGSAARLWTYWWMQELRPPGKNRLQPISPNFELKQEGRSP